MSELEGRWAEQPNGRVVRIIGVDGGTVLAETTTGQTVERPLSVVEARWRLLADDGLLVQAAADPAGLAARLEGSPVEVVVEAIRELGGDAETAQIQALLERVVGDRVGTGDAFKAWWRRVQQKLGDDPRIDDSRSFERRYRLLADGETKPRKMRGRLSDDERGGRRLADGPTLKSARELASRPRLPLTEEQRLDLANEAALADLTDLDPTDRFMAAELGTWIRERTRDAAIELLGEDLLAIDLLRVPHKASRTRALDWLGGWHRVHGDEWTWDGREVPPTLASAFALGDALAETASALAAALGIGRAALVERAVAWSYPGSEESRPWKLPDDYKPYLARLERFAGELADRDQEVAIGVERGALAALRGLAGTSARKSREDEIVTALARLATDARRRLPTAAKAPPAIIAELPPARLVALLQVPSGADGGWANTYRRAVEIAFERDPDGYRGVVGLLGTLTGEDPGAIALAVTRDIVRRARIAAFASAAAELATEPRTRAASAALAGTADPDDPRVVPVITKTAEDAAAALLDGRTEAPGPLVFTPASWQTFATPMHAKLAAADEREHAAEAAIADAERRVTEADAVATQARGALASTRQAAESQSRLSSARLAANVLKPVAAALADSLEAPSLEALQDRLAAILDRARIEPILEPGEVRPFDPDVHRWVGDGDPTDLVAAISPGFVARLEGEEDVVLVPARVVAPPQG